MDATSFAIVALLVAAVAFVLASYARSAARRAGMAVRRLEEARRETPGVAPAAGVSFGEAVTRLEETAEALRRRVASLEERLAVGASSPSSLASPPPLPPPPLPPPAPKVPPAVRVRRHFEALGYQDVEVIATDSDDATFTVEAQKGGAVTKGRAVVDDEGRVTARVAPSLRAFP